LLTDEPRVVAKPRPLIMSGFKKGLIASSLTIMSERDNRNRSTIQRGSGFVTRTSITRKDRRSLVQPPSHETRQSPKREPIVTGLFRRTYFVSRSMAVDIHGSRSSAQSRRDGMASPVAQRA
jgi:hypothetical protein